MLGSLRSCPPPCAWVQWCTEHICLQGKLLSCLWEKHWVWKQELDVQGQLHNHSQITLGTAWSFLRLFSCAKVIIQTSFLGIQKPLQAENALHLGQ